MVSLKSTGTLLFSCIFLINLSASSDAPEAGFVYIAMPPPHSTFDAAALFGSAPMMVPFDDCCEATSGELSSAAYKGEVKEVKRLLTNGININSRGADGKTALHWACRNPEKNKAVITLLLNAFADPNIVDDNEETALHVFTKYSADGVLLKKFLDSRANVNMISSSGHTPFINFCAHPAASIEPIRLFLSPTYNLYADATVNASANGLTPLIAFCVFGHGSPLRALRSDTIDIVRLLLDYKANICIAYKEKTAYQYARPEIQALLEARTGIPRGFSLSSCCIQ